MLFYLFVLGIIGCIVYFKFFRKTIPDPTYIGKVPQKKHAVVIGASMGGICAAKVLADHFQTVTLIERDNLDPSIAEARRGVPQAKQVHGLLARGCVIANSLFPGMYDEWVSHGAYETDIVRHFELQLHGVGLSETERMKDGPTLYGLSMSRPFIEFHMRRRLLQDCPNVKILDKTTALGLLYDKDTNTVKGVKIKRKVSKEEGDEKSMETIREDLEADFVVGASGRKNQIKKWLQEMGVLAEGEEPPQVACFPGLGYCTSRWRPPQGWLEKNKERLPTKILLPSPSLFQFGIGAAGIENNEILMVVWSYGKNYPPNNTKDILPLIEPALKTDKTNIFKRILDEWEQVGDWLAYHDERNIFYRWDKLGERWPQNLAVMGDTVATFNPSFGQGMTQALMHANALKEVLDKHVSEFPLHDLKGVSQKFQQAASIISNNFWSGVEPNDLQWPTTEGVRTKGKAFFAYFQSHIWSIACKNRDKMFKFILVMNGIADPARVLFHPEFLFPAIAAMAKETWENWQAQRNDKKNV